MAAVVGAASTTANLAASLFAKSVATAAVADHRELDGGRPALAAPTHYVADYSPGAILRELAGLPLPCPTRLAESEALVAARDERLSSCTAGDESTRSGSASSLAGDAAVTPVDRPKDHGNGGARRDALGRQELAGRVGSKESDASAQRRSQSRIKPSVVPQIGPGVTTLMVRNLPENITQKDLIAELNEGGFLGQYDFCYMPSTFRTGKGKSYAFVNFVSEGAARSFALTWHLSRRFGMGDSGSSLTIAVAEVQGAENMMKGKASNRNRIRNPSFRPFIAETTRQRLELAANIGDSVSH